MSKLRFSEGRRHADGFLRFLLRVLELQADAQTEARRLLRILLVRFRCVSAENNRCKLLLRKNEHEEY